MNRLLEIGFQKCGVWKIENESLTFELTQNQNRINILYAFVCDNEIKYVGKTTQMLYKRMGGYKNPGPTQSTNIRNNKLIKDLLISGASIEIFSLPDNGLMHYGQFHINLAAGLEDSIIKAINPEWNGGRTETQVSNDASQTQLITKVSGEKSNDEVIVKSWFNIILHFTYYHSGFFNVKVSDENLIGKDGERIEIYVGDYAMPIIGLINRRCNTNHTPRIMGYTGLRDWFAKAACVDDSVKVTVESPNSIRISVIQNVA